MPAALRELRTLAGVLLLDVPRYTYHLARPGGWIALGNRHDELAILPDHRGVRCPGRWSSDLHACHVMPSLGRRIMSAALRQWPIELCDEPRSSSKPQVSFVIPHRGGDRLPLLKATVLSILGQRYVPVECIVVEQARDREALGLPRGTRYIHLPHPENSDGWHKSWAYNVGVEAAKAEVVVCHDGDVLAPAAYAREILRHLEINAFEVAHLQRFLFCLSQDETSAVTVNGRLLRHLTPERVRQNWQGGTLAIRKSVFFDIGGYDESFVGWGGEDNEFFDRCQTRRTWGFGYLPFVHLWHLPQLEREDPWLRDEALSYMRSRLDIPAEERIREMRRRALGGREVSASSDNRS